MQKINIFFQYLIRIFMLFFITFIWTRFFVKKFWVALLLSILIALLIDLIIQMIGNKKKKKTNLRLKEKEDADKMFLSLATSKKEVSFFKNLASKRHMVKINKSFVTILHEDGNVLLFPHFSLTELNENDVNQIILKLKRYPHKKIVITCGEIKKECFNFIKNFSEEIILLDKYETYKKLYKEYNYFPEITISYSKDKKATAKQLLAQSFNKSKTKGYFLSSFVLLFSSIFIRLNLYYCIVSSILAIFALISFFNPFQKQKEANFSL